MLSISIYPPVLMKEYFQYSLDKTLNIFLDVTLS